MNTENLTIDLEAWANVRETSTEVAEAIFWVADSEGDADRIWQDPTETEIVHIADRATGNFNLDPHDMQWGVSNLGSILRQME